jgi:hypothetical protein
MSYWHWRGSIKQQTIEPEAQRMAEPDKLLGQHLSAFHAVDAARAEEIADLRRRLQRVERRLELAE